MRQRRLLHRIALSILAAYTDLKYPSTMKRTLPLLLLLILSTVPAQAQESGLSFLRIGVNAGAGAMGDGQAAASRGAFATYWNPAGLAGEMANSVAFSHHIWIAETRTYSFATRFQSGERAGLGLFVTAFDSGDLEARLGPGDADGLQDPHYRMR